MMAVANAHEPEALVTMDELLDPRGEYDSWKPEPYPEIFTDESTALVVVSTTVCSTGCSLTVPSQPPVPWPAINSFALLSAFWMVVSVRRRQVSIRSIMVLALGVAAWSAIFAVPLRALVR